MMIIPFWYIFLHVFAFFSQSYFLISDMRLFSLQIKNVTRKSEKRKRNKLASKVKYQCKLWLEVTVMFIRICKVRPHISMGF